MIVGVLVILCLVFGCREDFCIADPLRTPRNATNSCYPHEHKAPKGLLTTPKRLLSNYLGASWSPWTLQKSITSLNDDPFWSTEIFQVFRLWKYPGARNTTLLESQPYPILYVPIFPILDIPVPPELNFLVFPIMDLCVFPILVRQGRVFQM